MYVCELLLLSKWLLPLLPPAAAAVNTCWRMAFLMFLFICWYVCVCVCIYICLFDGYVCVCVCVYRRLSNAVQLQAIRIQSFKSHSNFSFNFGFCSLHTDFDWLLFAAAALRRLHCSNCLLSMVAAALLNSFDVFVWHNG